MMGTIVGSFPDPGPPMDHGELLKELKIDRRREPQRPSRPAWLWPLVAVLALGVGVGAWLALSGAGPAVVQVASVQPMARASATASVLDATGYITARRLATVSAKITGRVREVLIEEGMQVEAGQILATLDDLDARTELALAEARLAAERSQLAEIETNLANARREARRQQELVARKLTSEQAAEAAATTVEALAARLASARAQVTVSERALVDATNGVDDTIVRAPFAGVVTVKAAQPGEIISPLSAGGGFTRTGIGTIVDMESLEIQVDVNENFINRVQAGQPVEATLNAYPDWKIPAEVIAIIPTADRSKATVKVRIALKERDSRIVPDMGVRVAFLEERAAAAPAEPPAGVLVPRAAIRSEADGDVVYVLTDGKLVRRAVTTGTLTAGESRQVLDGVAAGEQVVVSGPADLADGQPATTQR
jgi:RND family efflux transporter MFP subunit